MRLPKSLGTVHFRGSRRQLIAAIVLVPIVFVASPLILILALALFELVGELLAPAEQEVAVGPSPPVAAPPREADPARDGYFLRQLSRTDSSTLFEAARQRSAWAMAFDGRDVLLVGEGGVQAWNRETRTVLDRPEYGRWKEPAVVSVSGSVLVSGLRTPFDEAEDATAVDRPRQLLSVWSDELKAGELTTVRSHFALASLSQFEALAIGGTRDEDTTAVREVELVSFLAKGPMQVERVADTAHAYYRPRAVTLSGGVMVIGSESPEAPVTHAEIFDPRTRTWSEVAELNGPHFNPVALAGSAEDRRSTEVVVITATDRARDALRSVEIWNSRTQAWRTLPGPEVPDRPGANALMLDDGRRVLLFGGGRADTEIFDTRSGEWSDGPMLAVARSDAAAVSLPGGEVLILGGYDAGGEPTGTLEIVNPSAVPPQIPRNRLVYATADSQLTRLADGRVLVSGGTEGRSMDMRATGLAEIIDPAARRSAPSGLMVHARAGHQTFVLPDGSVLAVGGNRVPWGPADAPSNIEGERWDPRTDTWSVVPGLDVPIGQVVSGVYVALGRAEIPFVLRANGSLIGFEVGEEEPWPQGLAMEVVRAWQWNAESGTKTPLPALTSGRDRFSAVELADGRLALIAGRAPLDTVALEPACAACPEEYVFFGGSGPSAGSDVFDFATQRWATGPTAAFEGGVALRLRDGRVLKVTNSWDPSAGLELVAEVADEGFTRWATTGSIRIGEDPGAYFAYPYRLFDLGDRVAVFVEHRDAFLWSVSSGEWSAWPQSEWPEWPQGDAWKDLAALDDQRMLIVPDRYGADDRAFRIVEVP